jgi:hypothetical protein
MRREGTGGDRKATKQNQIGQMLITWYIVTYDERRRDGAGKQTQS